MSAFYLKLIGALNKNSGYNSKGEPAESIIHLVTKVILGDSKIRMRPRISQPFDRASASQPFPVEILCGALGTFAGLWKEFQGLADVADREQLETQFFQLKFVSNLIGSLNPNCAKMSDPSFDASDQLNLNQLGFEIIPPVEDQFSIELDLDKTTLSVVFLPFAPNPVLLDCLRKIVDKRGEPKRSIFLICNTVPPDFEIGNYGGNIIVFAQAFVEVAIPNLFESFDFGKFVSFTIYKTKL